MFKFIKSIFAENDNTETEPEPNLYGCKCNLNNFSHIVDAYTNNSSEEFKKYADNKGYYYEFKYHNRCGSLSGGNIVSHQYQLICGEYQFVIEVPAFNFIKKACLTCETCLGWYIMNNHETKIPHESPHEYFDEIVQNMIRAEDSKEDDLKKAQKICGILEEI